MFWCASLELLLDGARESRLPLPKEERWRQGGVSVVHSPFFRSTAVYLPPLSGTVKHMTAMRLPLRLPINKAVFNRTVVCWQVFDEDTGRWRLVRGTGEIIERIVSRQEQQEIQQHASRWGWDHKVLSQASPSSSSGAAAAAAATKPPFRK